MNVVVPHALSNLDASPISSQFNGGESARSFWQRKASSLPFVFVCSNIQ
jgi:hypothetical protein